MQRPQHDAIVKGRPIDSHQMLQTRTNSYLHDHDSFDNHRQDFHLCIKSCLQHSGPSPAGSTNKAPPRFAGWQVRSLCSAATWH